MCDRMEGAMHNDDMPHTVMMQAQEPVDGQAAALSQGDEE
jgi:hypothetical protein